MRVAEAKEADESQEIYKRGKGIYESGQEETKIGPPDGLFPTRSTPLD